MANYCLSLKESFKKQCFFENLQFNDDVFSQTLLNCYNKFQDQELDKYKNYIWVAFKNNLFREQDYCREKMYSDIQINDDFPNFDTNKIMLEDYNEKIDEFYADAMNLVRKRFGETKYNLFYDYIENGLKNKDLSGKYNMSPSYVKDTLRDIKKYFRINMKKQHDELWEV